jgi:hypothetical protein
MGVLKGNSSGFFPSCIQLFPEEGLLKGNA